MTIKNLNYYRQRADEELAAAERAADPSIAQIHRDMAERYRDLMDGGTAFAPLGGPVAEPGPLPA